MCPSLSLSSSSTLCANADWEAPEFTTELQSVSSPSQTSVALGLMAALVSKQSWEARDVWASEGSSQSPSPVVSWPFSHQPSKSLSCSVVVHEVFCRPGVPKSPLPPWGVNAKHQLEARSLSTSATFPATTSDGSNWAEPAPWTAMSLPPQSMSSIVSGVPADGLPPTNGTVRVRSSLLVNDGPTRLPVFRHDAPAGGRPALMQTTAYAPAATTIGPCEASISSVAALSLICQLVRSIGCADWL